MKTTMAFAAATFALMLGGTAYAQCCDRAVNGSSCKEGVSPDQMAACIQSGDACMGGRNADDGPHGCVGAAGQYFLGSAGFGDARACTNKAAFECCQAGWGNHCP